MKYTHLDLIRAAETGNKELIKQCLNNQVDINEPGGRMSAPALHYAIYYKHSDIVVSLIEHGATLDCKDKEGLSAIQRAVFIAAPRIVRLLQKKGALFEHPDFDKAYWGNLIDYSYANLSLVDSIGSTLMHYAAANDQIQTLIFLKEQEAPISPRDKNANTPLLRAALNGHIEIINCLLKYGADLDEKNDQGNTALHLAALNGHTKIVIWLLEHGATFEKNNQGNTAFLCAAMYGHIETISWLLEHGVEYGVNLDEKNNRGNTAFHFAALNGHTETIAWLFKYRKSLTEKNIADRMAFLFGAVAGQTERISWLLEGLDLHEKDGLGNTALHLAALNGHTETLAWLLDHGASLKETNNEKDTALHLAALNGHIETISRLLEYGAILNEKNNYGNTAFHLAALNGHTKMITWLLERGACLNGKNNYGDTAFHLAVFNGYPETVEWLINQGVPINNQNYSGKTALYICAEQGHAEVAYLLVARGAEVNLRLKIITEGSALITAGNLMATGLSRLTSQDSALAIAQAKGHGKIAKRIKYAQEREQNWQAYQKKPVFCKKQAVLDYNADINFLKLAAKGGHPQAQLAYASWLTNNDGEKAIDFFGYAHFQNAGSFESFYQLAEIYAKGLGGVSVNIEKAAINYQKAAGLGHLDAAIQLELLQPQLREHRLGALITVIQGRQVKQALEYQERQEALRKSISEAHLQSLQSQIVAELFKETWCHILCLRTLGILDRSLYSKCKNFEGNQLALPSNYLSFGRNKTHREGIIQWQNRKFQPINKRNSLLKGLKNNIRSLKEIKPKLKEDSLYIRQAIDAIDGLIAAYEAYESQLIAAQNTQTQVLWMQLHTIMIGGYFEPACLTYEASHTLAPQIVIKAQGQHGTAAVYSLNGAHFKHNPHAPGVEFMVSSLGNLLVGQGATPTELVKVISPKGISYIYQASQTVVGQELETILIHHPNCIKIIKHYNFCAVVLLGILTNPQDGKADNYMVEFTVDPQTKELTEVTLIGIDNDLAFAEVAVVRHRSSEGGSEKRYFANVKNVLYFFPQMYQPVGAGFRKNFLKQIPELVVLNWLIGIHQKNQEYLSLLHQGVFTQEEFTGGKQSKRGLQLPIKLVPGTIKKVYRKLLRLQDEMLDNQEITLWELLESVEPELAKHYKHVKVRVDNANPKNEVVAAEKNAKLAVANIIDYMKDLYYGCIDNWEELKYFRTQVEAGNRGIMTEKVLKTCEDFGFEDNRTQGASEMLFEFLNSIEYERFNDKDTAELFYRPLTDLCLQIHQKSPWFLALEIPIPLLSHWLLKYHLVDVNEQNNQGYSALHFAVGQGDLTLVKKLLGQNANLNVVTKHEKTPLELIEHRIRVQGENPDLTVNQRQLYASQKKVAEYLKTITNEAVELQPNPNLNSSYASNRNLFLYQPQPEDNKKSGAELPEEPSEALEPLSKFGAWIKPR